MGQYTKSMCRSPETPLQENLVVAEEPGITSPYTRSLRRRVRDFITPWADPLLTQKDIARKTR